MRDRIFAEMTPEWKDAYDAGIFTEFMEQRAPGHTVLGDVIYRKGLLDLQADIDGALDGWISTATPGVGQAAGVEGHVDCGGRGDALRRAARRSGQRMAEEEPRPERRRELARIAEVCRRVPAHAPRDFQEALQAYWFVHLGVITELNTWDSFSPGRLDQHLAPFYERALRRHLDREAARELLRVFLGEVQQPAGAAEGGRDSGGERHLHRLLQHQYRRPEERWHRRRQRGHLPDSGSDRRDAPAAAFVESAIEQEESRPVPEAGPRDCPQRLGAALDLQRRYGGGGTAAAGQIDRGRARRRHQRVRRDGRVRQGSVHPDGLLQHRQGSGDHAGQRAAIRAPGSRSASRPATRASSALTTSCSRRSAGSCATSSTSRSAATT